MLAEHLYARFSRRFWALTIDGVVYAASALMMFLLLEIVRGDRAGAGGIFLLWLGFLCFYEPVLVWRRGATLGHMAANLRVVDLGTGGNPTFLRAFVRFWLKAFVGVLAFVFMGTTRRHQALHDLAARTTVEIADPRKALPAHFVHERAPLPTAGMPGWPRRVLVILAYSAASVVAVGVVMGATISTECLERNSACTSQEQLVGEVVGLLFAGLLAACIVFGWTGRLWGARRSHRSAAPHSPGAA